MTQTQRVSGATTVKIGSRIYEVDADGYCAKLEAWIMRDPHGRLVTIPSD